MQTLADIRRLLEERGLRPKRSLGQNFLIDQNLVRKLVDAAVVGGGDVVLEVGPGTGTLTEELLSRGCRVVACELDDHLAALLSERAADGTIPGGDRLRVVHADCLQDKHTLASGVVRALADAAGGAPPRRFALVANLPYGSATPLLSTLLIDHPSCAVMAVTVQREVGDRLTARPRTKEYGGLSVLAQALCEASRVAVLPPACFWPRPDVTSVMVVLRRRTRPLCPDARALSEFCREIFAHRRKQLGAALARFSGTATDDAALPSGVHPRMRAEELSVEQVVALSSLLGRQQARPIPERLK